MILGLDEIDKKMCFSPLELHDGRKLKLAPFGRFKISDVPKLVDKYMNNVTSQSQSFSYFLPFLLSSIYSKLNKYIGA